MKEVAFLIAFFMVFSIPFNIYAEDGTHIHQPHSHRHKHYAKIKNPVPMSEQSIAKGKALFEKHCISCHGESGSSENKTTDLTDDLWIHGESEGEIFHVITDGTKGTTMRGFKKETTKKERWHLVNYIKSLKKTEEDRR